MKNGHAEKLNVGVGSLEKTSRLNPRQRYNRWADAEIKRLRDEVAEKKGPERYSLKQLENLKEKYLSTLDDEEGIEKNFDTTEREDHRYGVNGFLKWLAGQ